MCLFIINPRVNSLKGVTAHHRQKSVTAIPGAQRVEASGAFVERLLCTWDSDPAPRVVVMKTCRGSEREGPL